MAVTILPSQERLRKLLSYCPETGSLVWNTLCPDDFSDGARSAEARANVWNTVNAGKPALASVKANGYLCGGIDYRQALQHRVIWKWMTGDEPRHIDHINGVPSDNRWANLRSVSRHENMRNMKQSRANKSGVTGVCRIKGKWAATGVDGHRTIVLGRFERKADAIALRSRWEAERCFHPNHGRAP